MAKFALWVDDKQEESAFLFETDRKNAYIIACNEPCDYDNRDDGFTDQSCRFCRRFKDSRWKRVCYIGLRDIMLACTYQTIISDMDPENISDDCIRDLSEILMKDTPLLEKFILGLEAFSKDA